MWQDKLSRIYVGAQAHRNTTARFEGVARFGFFMKLSGGTNRANAVRPYHALCGCHGLWDKQ